MRIDRVCNGSKPWNVHAAICAMIDRIVSHLDLTFAIIAKHDVKSLRDCQVNLMCRIDDV